MQKNTKVTIAISFAIPLALQGVVVALHHGHDVEAQPCGKRPGGNLGRQRGKKVDQAAPQRRRLLGRRRVGIRGALRGTRAAARRHVVAPSRPGACRQEVQTAELHHL